MDRTITYTPLIREVSTQEVADYRRSTRAQRPRAELIVQVVVGGIIALVLLFVVGTALIPALVIGFSGLAIDEAAPFDMEIVDQWLFAYSARPFPLADPHA